MATESRAEQLLIVIPVYDDWASLGRLLDDLDQRLAAEELGAAVVVVNDFSALPMPEDFGVRDWRALTGITVLDLVRNLGHQRAIATGLAWVHEHRRPEAVVVMDGDGEDLPEDAVRLYREHEARPAGGVVFAERERRSEGPLFRIFYHLYKLLFRVLTGKAVLGGNFTLLPGSLLKPLVFTPEIWNHYAAAILKTRLPNTRISTRRGRRYDGTSKMNFVSLIAHGLSAVSVFGEVVGIRMLIATMWLAAAILAAIGTTVWIRLGTDLAVPGWATYTTGILGILLLQMIILSLVFIFMILNSRQAGSFTPWPDALPLVGAHRDLSRGVE